MTRQELESMHVDELRAQAKERGIAGIWDMKKAELVDALTGSSDGSRPRSQGNSGSRTREAKAMQVVAGKSGKVVMATSDHEDRAGQTLVTRSHDVIRAWATARGAEPATVGDGDVRVLRFDFPGYGGDDLRHISWDEWFATFDGRDLNFLYQEHKADGADSNFFRLESPEREDA